MTKPRASCWCGLKRAPSGPIEQVGLVEQAWREPSAPEPCQEVSEDGSHRVLPRRPMDARPGA